MPQSVHAERHFECLSNPRVLRRTHLLTARVIWSDRREQTVFDNDVLERSVYSGVYFSREIEKLMQLWAV